MISIDTLNEYLSKKNIIVRGSYFKKNKFNSEEDILGQINLIREIDNILTQYSLIGYTRLYSTIGKRIENFKVEMKRLELDLKEREEKTELNDVDIFLLNNGNEILEQGKNAFKLLKNIDYISLIKRSMNLNEICLGRTDESNIRKNKVIEIGKLKNVSYNLREEDIYVYLKKLKRRNRNLKIEYYIDEFINISKLNTTSKEYVNILLSIPSDTLKQWFRYKEGRKDISVKEYLNNIKKALEYER